MNPRVVSMVNEKYRYIYNSIRVGMRRFMIKKVVVCVQYEVDHSFLIIQFWHRHVQDTVVILEEVNLPRP